MSRFMEINTVNPLLGQGQTAKRLGCSNFSLQRYTQDLTMLASNRIPPNRYRKSQKVPDKNIDDNSHRKRDLKRPQKTSNYVKKTTDDLKCGLFH